MTDINQDKEVRVWRNHVANLIESVGEAWTFALCLGLKEHDSTLYDLLCKVHEKALWRLAHNGGLAGAELCDECAEVEGTVTEVNCCDWDSSMVVYQRPPGSEYPDGGQYLADIGPEHFFRVPGSSAYGRMATAELLRQP